MRNCQSSCIITQIRSKQTNRSEVFSLHVDAKPSSVTHSFQIAETNLYTMMCQLPTMSLHSSLGTFQSALSISCLKYLLFPPSARESIIKQPVLPSDKAPGTVPEAGSSQLYSFTAFFLLLRQLTFTRRTETGLYQRDWQDFASVLVFKPIETKMTLANEQFCVCVFVFQTIFPSKWKMKDVTL